MPSVPQLLEGPQIIVEPTLEELITLKLEELLFGLRGVDLFEGPLGDGGPYPEAAIGVLEAAGGFLEPTAGPTARDLGTVQVQVTVRGSKDAYSVAKRRAEQVVSALHKQEIGGDIFACFAGTPFFIRRDKRGRDYLAVNLTLKTYSQRSAA